MAKKKAPEGGSVQVSMGLTVNAGNYNSRRVEVGLDRPIAPGETVEKAGERVFNEVKQLVSGQVNESIDLLDGIIGKKARREEL